jgi:hypothetical protein
LTGCRVGIAWAGVRLGPCRPTDVRSRKKFGKPEGGIECAFCAIARKIRKWKGKLLDVDLPKLRGELEASRDAIFAAAQIKPDLFRSN